MNHDIRIKRILRRLAGRNRDGLLLTNPANLRYASGFSGDDSIGLVSKAGLYLLTDFRYVQQAERDCPSFDIVLRKKSLFATARRLIGKLGLKTCAVETGSISHRDFLALARRTSCTLPDAGGLVEDMRLIKAPGEVAAIRRALAISERAYRATMRALERGWSEAALAGRLEAAMKERGADAAAFETIAALGAHSSMPHAKSTRTKLKGNEILLADWGARRGFYNSDLTRTSFVGKIPPDFRKIYAIVLDAQKFAIESIKPGRALKTVDNAARGYIARKGYGRCFGHGLGHGVGLDVHEGPTVGPRSAERARPGMVVTIEPGVYIPGWGGVRIEDMVLITKDGCEVLSKLPKGLRSVKA